MTPVQSWDVHQRSSHRLRFFEKSRSQTLGIDQGTMKFEERFRRHQEPKWAPNYLNYRAIKALLKADYVHSPQQNFQREPLATINEDVQKVERFYLERLASLRKKQKYIIERHGLDQDFLNAGSTPCVDHKEELASFLLEIANDSEGLQQFADLNRNALQRILDKLHADQKDGNDDHRSVHDLDQIDFMYQPESYWSVKKMITIASNLLHNHDAYKQYLDYFKYAEKLSHRPAARVRTFC